MVDAVPVRGGAMMLPGITVVTPTISPRTVMLKRARKSVLASTQYLRVNKRTNPATTVLHSIHFDHDHEGAARTRQRALEAVRTQWVAFLDDDDEFLPQHLNALYYAAIDHEADYVWSRFVITYPDGSELAGPAFLGQKAFAPWNDDDPCQTTITTLVRTELAREAGGFAQFDESDPAFPGSPMKLIDGHRRGEDHEFTVRCRRAGGQFHHHPEVTWRWHHHGVGAPGVPGNTSGMPDRW
jgi:hypothetical protein